jgi:hypothetical protein
MNMRKMLLDIPECIEARRIVLRCYRAGDGPWVYAMSQKNRAHLARYEAGNVIWNVMTPTSAAGALQNGIISVVWGQDVPETGTRASFPKLRRGYVERCGMVLEGHIREYKRNDNGMPSRTLPSGLLKREFEALGKNL